MADCPSCKHPLPGASLVCPFCGYHGSRIVSTHIEPPKPAEPVFQLWILDIDDARRDLLVDYLTRITKGKDPSQVAARLSHLPTLLFGSISLKAAENLVSSLQERGAKVEIRHLAAEQEPAPPPESARPKRVIVTPAAVREMPPEKKSIGVTWFLVAVGAVLVALGILLLVSYNRYMASPEPPFPMLDGIAVPTPPPPPPPEEVTPTSGDRSLLIVPGEADGADRPLASVSDAQQPRNLVREAEARYRSNDVAGAVALYRAQLGLRPDDERAAERLRFLERELAATGELMTKDNFYVDLQYQDRLPDGVEEQVSDAVYAAAREVGSDLGFFPQDRLTVIVYRDDAFRAIGFGPVWTNAVYDGKIRIPIPGGGAVDEPRLRRAVVHEYVHAAVHRMAGSRCPTWFNEGLALYEQGGGSDPFPNGVPNWRPIALERLAGAFTALPDGEVPSAYRTSYLAVRALVDRSSFGYLLGYLRRLGAGESPEEAFESSFFLGFTEFSGDLAENLRGEGG